MALFTSQFDRAREVSQAYAGDASETRFWTPAAVATVAGGAVVVAAMESGDPGTGWTGSPAQGGDQSRGDGRDQGGDQGRGDGLDQGGGGGLDQGGERSWDQGWGEGWEQGWDAGAVAGTGDEAVADDGGAWSHHGDYTGASVGGDEDFFYFIDGDSSLTIG